MSDARIEEIVRNAVAQAVERQLASLRETVVQEVLREVGPALKEHGSSGGSSSATLQKTIAAIQAGTTQKEILRALLDNTVLYSGRAALFVVKNGSATGWQGVAFGNNDAIKDFSLDLGSGLASRAMQSRTSQTGSAADMDARFSSQFGAAKGEVAVLPLLLKDKVSALVYADGGNDAGTLDVAALDVLVRATSAWLELIAQRKQAQKDGAPEPEMHAPAPAANDPFAAHAPLHSKVQEEPAPMAAMSAAAGWGGATSAPSGEDAEMHKKAQRFARLLIDEIKLYNHAKVSEGRKHKDLYDRLKEDIEKSRSTYQKRYGNTAAGGADYFSQELIRSLAEDDASLLGTNFRR
jgi:hypothetical protein